MCVGLTDGEKNVPEFSPAEINFSLSAIIRTFRRHRIRYLLIGAVVMSVWGRPRTTLDLDFLVQVDEKGLARVKKWAIQEGMQIDERWLEWNPLLANAQLRLQVGRITVDLLIPHDNHDQQAFRRRRRKKLGNKIYWFVSPEDFILQKLKVGRPRDFEDAVTVQERLRRELDMNYLKRWAGRLGIVSELRYVLAL